MTDFIETCQLCVVSCIDKDRLLWRNECEAHEEGRIVVTEDLVGWARNDGSVYNFKLLMLSAVLDFVRSVEAFSSLVTFNVYSY